MIRGLGAELHLAQPPVGALRRLSYGLGEELREHEVGAGAGHKEAARFYEAHAPQVDLPVSPYRGLHGAAGFREGGRIQDHHVVGFSLCLQLRQQGENIRDPEAHDLIRAV